MDNAARLTIFSITGGVCAVWTIVAGKDVNWDLLNYHYYLPFELVAGRLEQDFFAASAQSYLNPVGYLPFYFMVSSGWHSIAASVVLALAHSVSLALLYFLAWQLFGHLPRDQRILFSLLATAIGAATAVFWATVGSSFLDPLLVPLILAGLLALLREGGSESWRVVVAGACFGAAAALKYSNVIFGLAALPLVLTTPGLPQLARARAGLLFAVGGSLAFAVLAGPWLFLMYQEFGNPVFPLMNAWFQSPYAPPVNAVSERFALEGPAAVLAFPFRMVVLDRALYSEMFAPDIRFAALTVTAMLVPIVAFSRGGTVSNPLCAVDWRVLGFFLAGCVLWIATSANGRYGMANLLLVGVCLARLLERALPSAIARVSLLLLLAIQLGMSVLASPPRWFVADSWSRHWLPFDVPERALREPALYLTLETLPMAVVAPFVNPTSAFVNFRGQTSISPESSKLEALLGRYRGHVRVLGRSLQLVAGRPHEGEVRAYDRTLLRIGYRIDIEDCFEIAWRPDGGDLLSKAGNWISRTPPTTENLSMASCALKPADRDPELADRERDASALFDRIEKTCHEIFHGHTAVTEPLGNGWSRHYVGLDARLETLAGRVVLNRYRAGVLLDLGRLSDWENGGRAPGACVVGTERSVR